MGLFLIIIAVVVFIIIIIANSQQNSKKPQKIDYYTAAQYSIGRENKSQNNDDLYESIKQQHKNKTLSQIKRYIDFRREQDDGYWEYHRMEYKILMEYQREKQNADDNAYIRKVAAFTDKTPYTDLLDAYHRIRYNREIYPEVNFTILEARLATQSDIYFKEQIKTCKNTGLEIWLTARKKEGHYITKEMVEYAREIENSEPPLDRLKRQRKNYQTAIAKAKKENNTYLLLKYEELLAKNTELLTIERNR